MSQREGEPLPEDMIYDWELYACILWNKLISIMQNPNLNRMIMIDICVLDVDAD